MCGYFLGVFQRFKIDDLLGGDGVKREEELQVVLDVVKKHIEVSSELEQAIADGLKALRRAKYEGHQAKRKRRCC